MTNLIVIMDEENYVEIIMEILFEIVQNNELLQDVLERREKLEQMNNDTNVYRRHCHIWDIDAALMGNIWLADKCLVEYVMLIQEVTPWVGSLNTLVMNGNNDENVHMFLFLIVNLMMDGATRAKLALDKFRRSLEEDIIMDVNYVLKAFIGSAPRKTVLQLLKEDAYVDPSIAAMAEMTKGGLKTRNRFYKR